jgi:hypothetical protein
VSIAYTIIVWAKQGFLWFGTHYTRILSGVWNRIKIQLSSSRSLPLVYLFVGRAGDTRKGNLMESPILGRVHCLSKYTSIPPPLPPYLVAISVLFVAIFCKRILLRTCILYICTIHKSDSGLYVLVLCIENVSLETLLCIPSYHVNKNKDDLVYLYILVYYTGNPLYITWSTCPDNKLLSGP